MAYSQVLELVQGDTLPQLKVTIRDQNTAAPGKTLDPDDATTWKIVDLTGASALMKIRAVGATTLTDTLVGTVVTPLSGEVVFEFNPTTLNVAGEFEAEIEYESSGGGIQTIYDLLKLKVREQF